MLFVKVTPVRHETLWKRRQDIHQIVEVLLGHWTHEKHVADALDFDFLWGFGEGQFFWDAHGKGIAAFENSGQHACLRQVSSIYRIYVKWLKVKQHLAAILMLFNWLDVGQVLAVNPASPVRGPKHSLKLFRRPWSR